MKAAWRHWLAGVFLLQALIALGGAEVIESRKNVSLGDVTLTDGRTFKSVVVMSQSATSLSVKYAGGLTKLDKRLLPPALQAQFPVDEALAAQEQAAAEVARQQSVAAEQERQRKAAERARIAAENAAKAAAARPAAQSIGQNPVPNTMVVNLPTQQEQQARSPHGLFIVRWYQSGSNVYLTVRNAGTSSYKFDFRQVQALVQDSAAVVAPVDVVFQKTEIANYWLDGGKEQVFRLVFPSSPKFAAVSWTGTEEWRLTGNPYSPAATSKETAIQQSREVAVATKAANKASSAQREAEYNAKLLEKKVGK